MALNAACDVVESHESLESWNSMQPDALRTLEQADVADLERAAHHCALRDEDADWLSLWARRAFGADRTIEHRKNRNTLAKYHIRVIYLECRQGMGQPAPPQ